MIEIGLCFGLKTAWWWGVRMKEFIEGVKFVEPK